MSATPKPRRRFGLSWWWIIPILLVAFWLGARSLDLRPVWSDERRSVLDAYGSFWGPGSLEAVWKYVAKYNPWHSPGYFLVLHEWGQASGWDPAALRALSLLVAMGAIAFTYRLALALFKSPLTGIIAALVLMASAFYVHYSFEMRVYTMTALFSVFTLWAYARILQRRKASPWLYLSLFAGTVCLLYSHYLAAITLVGIGFYHLFFVPKNRRWWLISGTVVAGGLLFIPWLRYMLDGLELAVDKDDLHARALSTPEALWSFLYMFGNSAVVLVIGLVAAAFVALRGKTKWLTQNARLLLVIALVGLATLLIVNQVLMIMHEGRLRYFMPLWPLFALVISLGIVQLRRYRPVVIGLVAVWVFIGLWNTLIFNFTIGLDGADFVYPVQHIARAVKPYVGSDDIVVTYAPGEIPALKDNILEFYLAPLGVHYALTNDEVTDRKRVKKNAELLKEFQPYKHVWVGYPVGQTPDTIAEFRSTIAVDFKQCPWTTDNPHVVIELYMHNADTCSTPDTFGD